MQEILNIYKPFGISPLDAMERFRNEHPEYKDVKMTYAGRLDPAAEGVLLVLAGESVHKKEILMQLDKQYEADILLGISTDSYDILGMVDHINGCILEGNLRHELQRFQGSNILPVPPYSSYVVNGKPMFQWAREGKLGEFQIPKRTMTVHDVSITDMTQISADDLLDYVTKKVSRVEGDFRQEAILAKWKEVLRDSDQMFPIIKANLHVASGTYIRSLAHELGTRIGCGGILFNLVRTSVGEHQIDQSVRV